MSTTKFISFFAFLIFSISLISCSGSDDSNSTNPGSRLVKYELSGNYSGTLGLVYTNQDGAAQIEDNITLPWSKELTVGGNGMQVVLLTASTEVGGFGQPGETITGKIYVGGDLKETATVNSTNTGYISLNNLAYALQ